MKRLDFFLLQGHHKHVIFAIIVNGIVVVPTSSYNSLMSWKLSLFNNLLCSLIAPLVSLILGELCTAVVSVVILWLMSILESISSCCCGSSTTESSFLDSVGKVSTFWWGLSRSGGRTVSTIVSLKGFSRRALKRNFPAGNPPCD
uniref:Uncharacterized protein n=1 Tax=Glossina brevipalpis TaxID=37001 RepID=A0A1A9W2L9_9MUSC